MGIRLIAVTACLLHCHGPIEDVEGAFKANASAFSHFKKGAGWLWKPNVFMPKRNVVTVPNPRYMGRVVLCSYIACVAKIWAPCHNHGERN